MASIVHIVLEAFITPLNCHPRSLFVLNEYVGLTVLGALDVGGAIFVHAFGASFGLAAAAIAGRGRDMSLSSHLEASSYRQGGLNGLYT